MSKKDYLTYARIGSFDAEIEGDRVVEAKACNLTSNQSGYEGCSAA